MAYNLLHNTACSSRTISKSSSLGGITPAGWCTTSPSRSPFSSSISFSKRSSSTNTRLTQQLCLKRRGISRVSAAAAEDSLDNTGGGGGGGNFKGGGGGGGGDSNKDDHSDNDDQKKMATGMSMSQKLTLGYAALVGVGGIMGYVKSGSQKSLTAGGLSALLLYYVYTELPVRPAFASSIGFGISAALLAVMGSRFKRSGKIFPAGVVSFVSLVMTGGYLHGILRSTHA